MNIVCIADNIDGRRMQLWERCMGCGRLQMGAVACTDGTDNSGSSAWHYGGNAGVCALVQVTGRSTFSGDMLLDLKDRNT